MKKWRKGLNYKVIKIYIMALFCLLSYFSMLREYERLSILVLFIIVWIFKAVRSLFLFILSAFSERCLSVLFIVLVLLSPFQVIFQIYIVIVPDVFCFLVQIFVVEIAIKTIAIISFSCFEVSFLIIIFVLF